MRRSSIAHLALQGLLLLTPFACPHLVAAADGASEHAQLALLVRQLDLADRLADQAAAVASESNARYHFDYARLRNDMRRVRTGIHDYLTPARAQPRDPVDLVCTYRDERSGDGNTQ
ncbi:raqprd family integrative conjugative element protein [Paraburkholderia ginsengisoli]|uniref:Raqprd family integrative conjugative element protein n=2 Tax=Paraburkholderia ginsengisoli TaxID=311231 RepID=A0A7T4N565_9BURK|nr:raqprd family integrative conjugative element protein [Paraburkholderia ginsengisoli]